MQPGAPFAVLTDMTKQLMFFILMLLSVLGFGSSALAQASCRALFVTAAATNPAKGPDIGLGIAKRLSYWLEAQNRLPSLQSGNAEERWAARAVTILTHKKSIRQLLSPRAQKLLADAAPSAQQINSVPYDTIEIQQRYIGEDQGKILWSKSKRADVRFETRYLRTESERQHLELFIKSDGLLYDAKGNLYDTADAKLGGLGETDGSAIIVMTEDGRFFASKTQEVGHFHHSSFLAGRPVAFAGEIKVLQGRIVQLTNMSGHYMPTNQSFVQILDRLIQGKVAIESIVLKGTPPSLHTEALEHYFGPVKVAVIEQNVNYRIVDIAMKTGFRPEVLTRAFSMVNRSMPSELEHVHQVIKQGGSMGKTFRDYGFTVVKKQVERFSTEISPEVRQILSMDEASTQLNIYEFYAQKDDGPLLLYSTVAELDSPRVVKALKNLEVVPDSSPFARKNSSDYQAFRSWILSRIQP